MVFLPLLFFFLLHSVPALAQPVHKCDGGNYSATSTFGSNLNHLLADLSSSNATFYKSAKGDSPNRIYGLVLCRGDVDPSFCPTCYENLSRNVTQLCEYSKEATIWDPNCELRYSDMDFYSSLDTYVIGLYNVQNSTTDTFANMSRELSTNVSYQAAFNSKLMFATGLLSYSEGHIYALAQCTRDLTGDVCHQCLQLLLDFNRNSFPTKIGGWYIDKGCNYRYEVAPFYKGNPTIVLSQFSPPPAPSVAASPTPPAVAPPAPPTNSEDPNPNGGGKKNTVKVLSIAIALAVALILVSALGICFWKRSAKTTSGQMEGILRAESLLFDLKTLKVATNNFSDSNKLGRGGFGTVYKGILPDGQEIAVKRLSATSKQGLGELKNELLLVAKLQHKNLVRLKGVCLEEKEKLLVYEYLPNRSLDTFLYDPIKCLQLSWARRFEIIAGIARGLRYLHEESHLKVIHRDLKASNILLDADLKPKISDFGLARLFELNETHDTTSRVVGTFGYMAPEYAMRGQFSVKLDVFSFGVLVLEIVTGKKNNNYRGSLHAQDILSYTWKHWSEDTTLEIVDPSLDDQFSENEALRCIQIALLCVQDVAANRPLMSSVVIMLHSPSMTLQLPLQPMLGAGASTTSSSMHTSI